MSTSAKPTGEDFCVFRASGDDELWVEYEFVKLSEQEKTTFKKYLDNEGKLTIRKTAKLDGDDIETGYSGYVSEPQQWWLKTSEVSRLLKKEDVQEHAKTVPELNELLRGGGRITKQQVEEFQTQFIAAHRDQLTFSRVLENGPLLGAKNVAGGVLPDIYLVHFVECGAVEPAHSTLFSPSPALIYLYIRGSCVPAHSELLRRGPNHDTRGSGQETQQIQSQDIPFDHGWR